MVKEFTVKPVHLLLLKEMHVTWNDCEFGAPMVDPKRPFGGSDVEQTMLEIIGLKEIKAGVFEFELNNKKWILKGDDKYNIYLEGADEEKLCEELNNLLKEMKDVMQISFINGKLEVGKYKADDYSTNWQKVDK